MFKATGILSLGTAALAESVFKNSVGSFDSIPDSDNKVWTMFFDHTGTPEEHEAFKHVYDYFHKNFNFAAYSE